MAARNIITVADLPRLTSPELANLLRDPSTASKVAVIDVRDSDHIGGHIKGSSWVPTSELEARIPELIRLNRDKDKVVFHCMLSQQRGPSSALKFMRALQAGDAHPRIDGGNGPSSKETGDINSTGVSKDHTASTSAQKHPQMHTDITQHRPKVYVLEGGFGMWAPRYGEDARLTEAFVKDLWE